MNNLAKKLVEMVPREKPMLGKKNRQAKKYNAALADVKAILSKVEVDEGKIARTLYPYLAGIAGGITFGAGISWSELKQKQLEENIKEIASAIAKNLPIKGER